MDGIDRAEGLQTFLLAGKGFSFPPLEHGMAQSNWATLSVARANHDAASVGFGAVRRLRCIPGALHQIQERPMRHWLAEGQRGLFVQHTSSRGATLVTLR